MFGSNDIDRTVDINQYSAALELVSNTLERNLESITTIKTEVYCQSQFCFKSLTET